MTRRTKRRSNFFAVIALGVTLALAGPTPATEWPSWRGPDSDGTSRETDLVDHWSPQGENLIWHTEFIGRSTPVVFNGQACVIGRVGEGVERQEVVACYDAETGRKNWEHRHNVYNTTVPFNRVGWASLVGDPLTGNIYAHGVAGQLIGFDAKGKILWQRFLTEDCGELSGYGGRTQTPMVYENQLILGTVTSGWGQDAAPRHRYFSFDKLSGQTQWIASPGKSPYDMNTQSGPVVAEIHGVPLLISGNADGQIYAMKAGTGELVWSFELSQRGLNSNVLVHGNMVFASHSEENPDDALMGRMVAIDATGKGDVSSSHERWRINELTAGFPSPTYHDGVLYQMDNSANLVAIDAATGTVRWTYSAGTVGKGSPVWADGKLYVTETNGRLHILQPGPEGAKQLDSDEIELEDGRYAEIYASVAIAYGRIYLATEGGLYCIGDKSKPFKRAPASKSADASQAGSTTKRDSAAGAAAAVATIQVVPAEVLSAPGETTAFRVRAFDGAGRLIDERKATWSLTGVPGSVDENGAFKAGAVERQQVGTVTARVGELVGSARIRVIAPLPWNEDFESYEAGSVPPTWIGAPGKWKVQELAGSKVLQKPFRETGLLRNELYMGPQTLSGYTIEADVMGNQRGRRKVDVGLIAQGYTMDLMGAHQRIEIRSWSSENRIAQEVDFPWEMGAWYRMKLRVDIESGEGRIRGKVWPRDAAEPANWTIEVKDPLPIGSGSPGLVGYSPADIQFDNVKVMVNK